jgi:hypothetical protein
MKISSAPHNFLDWHKGIRQAGVRSGWGRQQETLVTCRKVAGARTMDEAGLWATIMSSMGTQNSVKSAVSELESMLSESPGPDRVCLKVAQILRVRRSEVALLRLDKGSLRFIFPPELRSAGVLPLTGSAVAVRTAATCTPLLSNAFMRVRHVSLFEAVKLEAEEEDRSLDQMPIQKIMSVAVAPSGGTVKGVVQVSRKGLDPSLAGADFTGEDLKLLEQAAEILARMPFMQEGAEI